jgi:hypothetical protein
MTGVIPLPAQPGSECTTCLEPLADDVVRMARCGHMFHCTCILAWFQSGNGGRNRCPNCRALLYTQVARVGEQRGVPDQAQLDVQRRVDEARRRRDEALQREDEEYVAMRRRLDARRRQLDQEGERQRQSNVDLADEMRQSGELNRQQLRLRLSQLNEEQACLQENLSRQLNFPRQQDTVPAIPQGTIDMRAMLAPLTTGDLERILQRDTSISEPLRRHYLTELDLRRTEDRNNNASTTAGAEDNISTRSHPVPPASRDRRRRPFPLRAVADSNLPSMFDSPRPPPLLAFADFNLPSMFDSPYQQGQYPQPSNPAWSDERLFESQRAQTPSSRSHRGETGQIPRASIETANLPRAFHSPPTNTPAGGPLPRPGLVQGIDRPGTPISPQENSPESTRASSPLLMTGLAVDEPFPFPHAANTATRVAGPQVPRPDLLVDPGTEPLATDHWYGNFSYSPRANAPTRGWRPAQIVMGSPDLRENIMNTQRQTTTLEIPRPDQEMRDFMRETDPSPTTGYDRDSASRDFYVPSSRRTSSSMEHHRRLRSSDRQAPPSPPTGHGGDSTDDLAPGHRRRTSYVRAVRNRQMPFPAGHHPSVQRQQASQSPDQDVYMEDADTGPGADPYLRSGRRRNWG